MNSNDFNDSQKENLNVTTASVTVSNTNILKRYSTSILKIDQDNRTKNLLSDETTSLGDEYTSKTKKLRRVSFSTNIQIKTFDHKQLNTNELTDVSSTNTLGDISNKSVLPSNNDLNNQSAKKISQKEKPTEFLQVHEHLEPSLNLNQTNLMCSSMDLGNNTVHNYMHEDSVLQTNMTNMSGLVDPFNVTDYNSASIDDKSDTMGPIVDDQEVTYSDQTKSQMTTVMKTAVLPRINVEPTSPGQRMETIVSEATNEMKKVSLDQTIVLSQAPEVLNATVVLSHTSATEEREEEKEINKETITNDVTRTLADSTVNKFLSGNMTSNMTGTQMLDGEDSMCTHLILIDESKADEANVTVTLEKKQPIACNNQTYDLAAINSVNETKNKTIDLVKFGETFNKSTNPFTGRFDSVQSMSLLSDSLIHDSKLVGSSGHQPMPQTGETMTLNCTNPHNASTTMALATTVSNLSHLISHLPDANSTEAILVNNKHIFGNNNNTSNAHFLSMSHCATIDLTGITDGPDMCVDTHIISDPKVLNKEIEKLNDELDFILNKLIEEDSNQKKLKAKERLARTMEEYEQQKKIFEQAKKSRDDKRKLNAQLKADMVMCPEYLRILTFNESDLEKKNAELKNYLLKNQSLENEHKDMLTQCNMLKEKIENNFQTIRQAQENKKEKEKYNNLCQVVFSETNVPFNLLHYENDCILLSFFIGLIHLDIKVPNLINDLSFKPFDSHANNIKDLGDLYQQRKYLNYPIHQLLLKSLVDSSGTINASQMALKSSSSKKSSTSVQKAPDYLRYCLNLVLDEVGLLKSDNIYEIKKSSYKYVKDLSMLITHLDLACKSAINLANDLESFIEKIKNTDWSCDFDFNNHLIKLVVPSLEDGCYYRLKLSVLPGSYYQQPIEFSIEPLEDTYLEPNINRLSNCIDGQYFEDGSLRNFLARLNVNY